ncbi:MAG TPA: hypothetical protein VEB22_05935 [Phycisphaerales bacterium]|nr:hypothetical protein [Phycisphaerales bacterium]
MELRDFLDSAFVLFWSDDESHAVIQAMDKASGKPILLNSGLDESRATMKVDKGVLARAIEAYAHEKGHEALEHHPSRVMQDYGYDLYRGKMRSPIAKALTTWLATAQVPN